jgi:BCD family chlorophyll transporter-like MFS transporter
MLNLAGEGTASGEGARMGVWGASQAIAFGTGGLLGAVVVDRLRHILGQDSSAFQIVFAIEAVMFILAALAGTGTRLTRTTLQEKVIKT